MRIALINHKGGVGKTTLAVNIAFYYKEKGERLLLVDVDEQHNSLQLFSVGRSFVGAVGSSYINYLQEKKDCSN